MMDLTVLVTLSTQLFDILVFMSYGDTDPVRLSIDTSTLGSIATMWTRVFVNTANTPIISIIIVQTCRLVRLGSNHKRIV
jgi:hypothetical protein